MAVHAGMLIQPLDGVRSIVRHFLEWATSSWNQPCNTVAELPSGLQVSEIQRVLAQKSQMNPPAQENALCRWRCHQ